jgi:ankyrin repeat protein
MSRKKKQYEDPFEEGKIDVNDFVDEVTFLGLAIDSSNPEIVKLMLENGADPDFIFKQKDKDISPDVTPPLLAAVDSGNLEIVKLLVECGADVNTGIKWNDFALLLAYEEGYQDIFDYLYPLTSEEGIKKIP